MAYVTTEMTKAVRIALKEQMPGWKIRVAKNADDSTICITIHKAPKCIKLKDEFIGENANYGHMSINHYHLNDYTYEDEYRKIIRIMKEATASVGQAYYYDLRIGSYEKPYLNKKVV